MWALAKLNYTPPIKALDLLCEEMVKRLEVATTKKELDFKPQVPPLNYSTWVCRVFCRVFF